MAKRGRPKKQEEKRPRGRPPKWDSPDRMAIAMEAYFGSIPPNQYRVTALALALDLTREGLNEYSQKPDFSDVVKKAKDRVADSYETDLRGKYVAGAIFALKNMGWSDRQEVEHIGDFIIQVVYDDTLHKDEP